MRMPNGTFVALGGSYADGSHLYFYGLTFPYERNDETVAAAAPWSIPGAPSGGWNLGFVNYPIVFPMSDNVLFFAGGGVTNSAYGNTKYDTFKFTLPYGGQQGTNRNFLGVSEEWDATCTIYVPLGKPVRIIRCGGKATNSDTAPAVNKTFAISPDVDNDWEMMDDMTYTRIDHCLVWLADGTLLAVGGGPVHYDLQQGVVWNYGDNRPPELINPADASPVWQTLAAASPDIPRAYHMTAMLLADGSVAVAGCDVFANPIPQGDPTRPKPTADRFYPPYLFDANSQPLLRPKITSCRRM
jgi:hypothetical protein